MKVFVSLHHYLIINGFVVFSSLSCTKVHRHKRGKSETHYHSFTLPLINVLQSKCQVCQLRLNLVYINCIFSNFMAISRTSLYVVIFCYISCSLIGVRNAGMNHFLCWMSLISKLTLSISVLNLWSKSQTITLIYCLISFNSLMYSASELFNKPSLELC